MADQEIFEKLSPTEVRITKTETKESVVEISELKQRLERLEKQIQEVQAQRDLEISGLTLQRDEVARLIQEAAKIGVEVVADPKGK